VTDTRNAANLFAAGDAIGHIAPAGTTPPTAFEDLAAPWINLGWLSTGGITYKLAETQKEVMAAGTLDSLRTITSEAIKTWDIDFLESLNPAVRALYDDVLMSLLQPSSGTVASYVLPEVPSNLRYAYVFDTSDGGKRLRSYAPAGGITSRGSDQQQQSDAETIQMTITAYPMSISGTTMTVKRYIDFGAESDLTPFF
jgi:hypothetical protein